MAVHYGGRLLRLKHMLIRDNLCTEPYGVGVIWVLLINCLGSPFCVYIFDCEVDTKPQPLVERQAEYQ